MRVRLRPKWYAELCQSRGSARPPQQDATLRTYAERRRPHRRAAPIGALTVRLLYQRAVTAAQPHGGGSTWTSWATHNAYTQVTVTLEHDYGQPADTPTAASRVYAVAITPTGRDHHHRSEPDRSEYVFAMSTCRSGRWCLLGFQHG